MSDTPDPEAGGFDLSALLDQAQQMQSQLMAAQEEQASQTVTGTAGGGLISIEMTGAGAFNSVSVSPKAVDPDDVELLEELILAALHDATRQVAELQQAGLGGLDMGGLDLGGLGGMLGGS